MHEGVGGRWGSGGGIEGGPVPRTSLAHRGGRRWEGGRPGPPRPQPRAPLCRVGAAATAAASAALRTRPRLEPGGGERAERQARVVREPVEGRGFQAPAALLPAATSAAPPATVLRRPDAAVPR